MRSDEINKIIIGETGLDEGTINMVLDSYINAQKTLIQAWIDKCYPKKEDSDGEDDKRSKGDALSSSVSSDNHS